MTIPACHNCGSSALPFAVALDAGLWRHSCGALVCPACGDVPAVGDTLCGMCRGLVGAIRIDVADVVRIGRPVGTPSAARTQRRGRRGR